MWSTSTFDSHPVGNSKGLGGPDGFTLKLAKVTNEFSKTKHHNYHKQLISLIV